MSNLRRTFTRALSVTVLFSGSLGLLAMAYTPAHADPGNGNGSHYVGVGSDTIQDIADALAGADPFNGAVYNGAIVTPHFYTPMVSSNATGAKTIYSFDAIPAGGSASAPGSITTTFGGPTFDRPNGSGNGKHALQAAFDVTDGQGHTGGWEATTASATNTIVSTTGSVQFARSSSGPSGTSGNFDYIPIGHDAVSYAYIDPSGIVTANGGLTADQLRSLYVNGTLSVPNAGNTASVTLHACLPQSGSGTRAFWMGGSSTGLHITDSNPYTPVDTTSGCGSTNEENGADSFLSTYLAKTSGTTPAIPPTDGVVIPFSAASWIAQANQAALDRSANGRSGGGVAADVVNLGDIGASTGTEASGPGLNISPVSGTAPNLTPNDTFYSAGFGRDVYIILWTTESDNTGRTGLKDLFVSELTGTGTGYGSCTTAGCPASVADVTANNARTIPQICTTGTGGNQATVNKFGFSSTLSSGHTCGVEIPST